MYSPYNLVESCRINIDQAECWNMLQSCTFHNRTSDVRPWRAVTGRDSGHWQRGPEVKAICQTAHQGRVATLTIGANKSVGWYVLTSHADYFCQTFALCLTFYEAITMLFPSIRTVRIKVRIVIHKFSLSTSGMLCEMFRKINFWKQWSPNVQQGCWADSCWNQSPDTTWKLWKLWKLSKKRLQTSGH